MSAPALTLERLAELEIMRDAAREVGNVAEAERLDRKLAASRPPESATVPPAAAEVIAALTTPTPARRRRLGEHEEIAAIVRFGLEYSRAQGRLP